MITKTRNKKIIRLAIMLLIIISSLLITGCGLLSYIYLRMCDVMPNADHCFQQAAVETGNPDMCEKIEGKDFETSNPPKDKCYLIIAEQKGDADICDNIVGGLMSYSKDECYGTVAGKTNDPRVCEKIRGTAKQSCLSSIASKTQVSDLESADNKVNDLVEQLKDDPDNEELKKQLQEAQSYRDALGSAASESVKSEYVKSNREEILSEIEDDDVKSAISKEFIKYKLQNKDASPTDLVKQIKKIKEEQELVKKLDEQANKMIDDLKSGIMDKVNEEIDGKVNDIKDELAEKGWNWLWKNSGADMKYKLSKLESLKNSYDKASEQYNKLNEKYAKIKAVYDEMKEIYGKIDEVNTLVATGKVDKNRGNVLKGGVLLGKGLEYATSYVPVFGSTVSTITKETFDASMKLATKRAERSKSLDDCFDDPNKCFEVDVSAY